MRHLLLIMTLILGAPLTAAAALEVAATTPNMGMLARTVGGEHVNVVVLAPGDRDVHHLEARPSMMVGLRRADLLVAVGAELEIGWLPAAIPGARNPRVLPGRPGYFEAAGAVELLGEGTPADRGLGDVHPMGNPHIYFDPIRMGVAAEALAVRLGELDPANAGTYLENARAFSARMAREVEGWQARVSGTRGVLLYHKDADYLMDRLGVTVYGYIEPLPGIPPTARHINRLVEQLRDREGVIFHMGYEAAQGPERLARELGWQVFRMSNNVPERGTEKDYVALVESWVTRLESR
jgi:zinc/manganese transport system substrate-binding protein